MHLITCRTNQAEILFVPQGDLNYLLGGIIAFYAVRHEIKLYAVTILGNHYHILCSAQEAKLPIFAENINREMALRVNRLLSRKGFLWGRRYDDQITIEPVDALDGLIYTTTNPVKHGLVDHPRNWPGVSTYFQVLGEKPQVFGFMNYTEYKKAKRKAKSTGEHVRREDFETKVPLKVEVLPIHEDLSEKKRIERLSKLIEERVEHLKKERKQAGKGFLGRKNILAQKRRGTFPRDMSNSPRPDCYSKNPEKIKEYREAEKERTEWYVKSSRRFRIGDYSVDFPPHCLLPPLHHVPLDTSPPFT